MAIGWPTAFEKAFAFIVYSLIWDIIGSVLMAASVIPLIGQFASSAGIPGLSGSALGAATAAPSLAVSVVLFVVGLALLLLGNTAAFFKVFGDIIAEDVVEKLRKEQE